MGNEGRFLNDFRGIRNRPNVEFRERWQYHMGVFTLSESVDKGDELVVTYGKGFWDHRRES